LVSLDIKLEKLLDSNSFLKEYSSKQKSEREKINNSIMVVYFNIFLCLIEKFLNLNIFIFTELNLFATLLSDTTKRPVTPLGFLRPWKIQITGQNSPGYRTEVLRISEGWLQRAYIYSREGFVGIYQAKYCRYNAQDAAGH